MIDYPNVLNVIFEKLSKNSIHPIIVGGYVRDYLRNEPSKDIDIELYGISSYTYLETLLEEFGTVNSVGKSFGVCKLQLTDLEIDFSFPRLDSKIASGHSGFAVSINADLDFKTAASRRDFTINAIGYDIENKKLLDPFNGLEDLQKCILRMVDKDKFSEDPLRVYRAVQFSARFGFELDPQLITISKQMVKMKLLQELPRERIYEELKKVLFKAKQPSLALILLKELTIIQKFPAFENLLNDFDFIAHKQLTHKQLSHTLNAIIDIIDGDTTKSFVLSKISKELQREKNLLQGKDLITLGIKPSKEFSIILEKVYKKQLQQELNTKQDALNFVKSLL